jgi:hypothetical protein
MINLYLSSLSTAITNEPLQLVCEIWYQDRQQIYKQNAVSKICVLKITNITNIKHGNTETTLQVSSKKLSPENHEWHRDKPMAGYPLHTHRPELEGLAPVSVLPY